MSASLRAQIDELRDEVRGLRGRLEEMEHAQRLKPASGETGEKPREDRAGPFGGCQQPACPAADPHRGTPEDLNRPRPAPKPESRIRPESAAKVPSEEELYNKAKQAFDQGNTAQARRGFEELIQRYPDFRQRRQRPILDRRDLFP